MAAYLHTHHNLKMCIVAELQIRGAIEDNLKIIFIFLKENLCCDPSLEPSHNRTNM